MSQSTPEHAGGGGDMGADMYDFEWHARHAQKTQKSAELVLEALHAAIPFESALDVGCGSGLWLDAARHLGCADVYGIDGPWTEVAALKIPASRFRVCDLAEPFKLARRFDLAMSLEVAEHVNPNASEIFIDNLVAHADFVVFGAAIPYQGGFRHINEQWQSAWRERFEARGYQCVDLVRPQIWNAPDVHYWYKQNLLVYLKRTRTDLLTAITSYMAANGIVGFPTDVVHPEKYEAIASYQQIAFKPLARRLPRQLGAKLRDMALMRA